MNNKIIETTKRSLRISCIRYLVSQIECFDIDIYNYISNTKILEKLCGLFSIFDKKGNINLQI